MKKTLAITGMSCNHCVMAVRGALDAVEGLDVLDVSIGSADVAIQDATIEDSRLSVVIEEEGFTLTEVTPSS